MAKAALIETTSLTPASDTDTTDARLAIGGNNPPADTEENRLAAIKPTLDKLADEVAWAHDAAKQSEELGAASKQTLAHAIMVLILAIAHERGEKADGIRNAWRNMLATPKQRTVMLSLATRAFVGEPVSKPNPNTATETETNTFEVYARKAASVRRAFMLAVSLATLGATPNDYEHATRMFNVKLAVVEPVRGDVAWSLSSDKHRRTAHVPLNGRKLYFVVPNADSDENIIRGFEMTAAHVENCAKHRFIEEVAAFKDTTPERAPRPGSNPPAPAPDGQTKVDASGNPELKSENLQDSEEAARKAADEERRQMTLALNTADFTSLILTARSKIADFKARAVRLSHRETDALLNNLQELAQFRMELVTMIDNAKAERKAEDDKRKAERERKEAERKARENATA